MSKLSMSADRTGVAARKEGRAGWLLMAPYAALMLGFGLIPIVYAVYLSLTNEQGYFNNFANYRAVIEDFRFADTVVNVLSYVFIWIVSLMLLVTALALAVHALPSRSSLAYRALFYFPGALTGVASVILWLFMLDPTVSPIGFLLRGAGIETFAAVLDDSRLPWIFTIMAFWTGAGGWIVILFGGLQGINPDLLEAARVDGANPWQQVWHIKIPLIRKWIAYMGLMAFANGTQIFVEPQALQSASGGLINATWAPNQLAMAFAFQQGDFGMASALSILMLGVGLTCALIVVFRTGMFERA